MRSSCCQFTALIFAVLAVTPCACKKTQCGSDGVCNDDATDEIAALQVHVNLSTTPTPIQSKSDGKLTEESNILIDTIDDANTMMRTTNAVKETIKTRIQTAAKQKPSNLTDVLAIWASGRVLRHFLKEGDLYLLLTHQAIPQNHSSSFSDALFSIASGACLKMILGIDDLIWLGPVIASTTSRIEKFQFVMIYGVAIPLVVACAVYLGTYTDALGDDVAILDFWISIVAGVLLMIYSTYMAYAEGWFARCGLRGDDDEDDNSEAECSDATGMTLSQVFTIAILGSVDDFAALFIMATSGLFTWWSMVIGTCLGSVIMGSLVMLSTESQTISSLLRKIPVPLVLFLVGVVVTRDAFEHVESSFGP